MKIEGDTLSSSHPEFTIRFKKAVADVRYPQLNNRRIITFTDDPRVMVVQVIRSRHSERTSAMPSLRQVAFDLNHYYLGEVKFGGQEWVKTAYYDGRKSLYCGYFTNKDDDYIFISIRYRNLSKIDLRDLANCKNSMTMSERGMSIINEQFAYLDEVADIL
jgi:hypothetical protein